MSRKIAVVGSRSYAKPMDVINFVKDIGDVAKDAVIISGGASGVDTLAERTAEKVGLAVVSKKPKKHTIDALMARNTEIVTEATEVYAFWDGHSGGTKDTIRKACRAGKFLMVVIYPKNEKAESWVRQMQLAGRAYQERVQAAQK